MALAPYFKKRNFAKTPEPKGRMTYDEHHLFVIQKHDASHLHYDFRLALSGVLKSWAVPKGPSLDPKVKRLAIHVEDHPLAYGHFEGTIPKGQYGGGTVMLWDQGTWTPLDDDPRKAYQKGHLRFTLQGKKLQGRWDLVRFKDNQHWFLIKFNDEYARRSYDITQALTHSVISDSSLDEIAKRTLTLPKGLTKKPFPKTIQPQLATLVDTPPTGDSWLHEIKFDGYRMIAFKKGPHVDLTSRNHHKWTASLKTIVDAIAALPYRNMIVDGEIIVLNEKGHPDFQLLQNCLKHKDSKMIIYVIFDLLYFDHFDLRHLPLIERKNMLKTVIPPHHAVLQYSDHIEGNGPKMLSHVRDKQLEGIISKHRDSSYHPKRTQDWLKIKCVKRQEFVIGGYTLSDGKRAYFKSLCLGVYDKKGLLTFVGNVGTGFSEATLKSVYDVLQKHKTNVNPFSTKPPGSRDACWVKPLVVCEVAFTEWTQAGHLRHPSFQGLRCDKKAKEVIREQAIAMVPKKTQPTFKLTHPDKVLYPEDNITKADLLTYYDIVSDKIIPFLKHRPLTLLRCPTDFSKCFYQRHVTQSTLNKLQVVETHDHEKYLYLSDKKGLFSLVQMGVLEIHPWGSRIEHLEKPDIIIFDLDPAPDVPWSHVVKAAKDVQYHLAQYHLTAFVKSTGGKGLHVVVPIEPDYTWQEVKTFTHLFVQFMEKLKPNEYVSNMAKAKRKGKIFIDYLRNQRTATAIGVYSTRARLHAPVSTPLFWDELSQRIDDNSYTIKTLPNRLAHLKTDPWADFWTIKQSLRLNQLN